MITTCVNAILLFYKYGTYSNVSLSMSFSWPPAALLLAASELFRASTCCFNLQAQLLQLLLRMLLQLKAVRDSWQVLLTVDVFREPELRIQYGVHQQRPNTYEYVRYIRSTVHKILNTTHPPVNEHTPKRTENTPVIMKNCETYWKIR